MSNQQEPELFPLGQPDALANFADVDHPHSWYTIAMITIALQEPKLIAEIMEIAEHEGQSATDFVVEAVERYIALYRQKRIQAETEAWYTLPVSQRQRYAGQYVAVLGGKIVDSDPKRLALYYRLKERFGREPVLIIEGGELEMPTYHITSARYP